MVRGHCISHWDLYVFCFNPIQDALSSARVASSLCHARGECQQPIPRPVLDREAPSLCVLPAHLVFASRCCRHLSRAAGDVPRACGYGHRPHERSTRRCPSQHRRIRPLCALACTHDLHDAPTDETSAQLDRPRVRLQDHRDDRLVDQPHRRGRVHPTGLPLALSTSISRNDRFSRLGMSITAYNYLFAKKTLFRHWRRLKLYLPIVGVQIMLLYVFLILSIGFAYLSLVPQMLVILVFPIVKMRLKHLVWKYAQRLDDISTDVTVCLLEISGALFQTVCMQFVTSTALNALVLVTDLVQAVHEVHAYMKMDYLGDGKRMLVTARKIIESSVHPGAESKTESPLFQQGGSSHRDAVTSAVTDGSDRALRLRPSWWRSRSSDNSTGPNTTRYLDEDNPTLGLDGKRRRHLQNVHANSVFIASNAVHLKSSRRLLDLDQAHDEFINPNASEALAQSMHSTVEATNGLHTPPSVLDQTLETTPPTGIHREVVPLQRKSSNRRSKSAVVVRLRRAFRVLRRTKSSRERHRYRYTDSPGSSFQNLQALGPNTKSAAQVYPVTSDEVAEHTSHRDKETTHQIERPTGHKPRRRGLAVTIDGIVIPRRDQARILEQTLQLLFACEVLLFAECMEVVIPFLYALCLGCDWLLPNEQYNLVVRGMSESNVDSMLVSSLVYALLELASLLVMYYVMKTKYGVSAFCQLAFVLEHYVLTLQGKMVGLFIVIWNAATVHQATTFGSF